MRSVSDAESYVRKLQQGDVPVLRALLGAWLPAEPDDSASHEFRVLVQRTDAGERLAGIAEFQQVLDEATLLGIAIVPDLQRRGLGRTLLLAVLAELRAKGCTRCLLEVRRSNTAAQALYEQAQFTLDGIRRDYYPAQAGQQREDALLFSRQL